MLLNKALRWVVLFPGAAVASITIEPGGGAKIAAEKHLNYSMSAGRNHVTLGLTKLCLAR